MVPSLTVFTALANGRQRERYKDIHADYASVDGCTEEGGEPFVLVWMVV